MTTASKWDDTLLKDSVTKLTSQDIKQLLINRKEHKDNLKQRKSELISLLKQNPLH